MSRVTLLKSYQKPHRSAKSNDYSLTVIAEVESPVNGTLLVTTNPLLGINIITPKKIAQSGEVMVNTWKNALVFLKSHKFIKNVLILGYGGGSASKLIHQYWPSSSVTGIEIDPIMINLGKKFLRVKQIKDKIIISDAYHFETNNKYDLILVDLFINDKMPNRFQSEKFLKKISQRLTSPGFIIINILTLPANLARNTRLQNILFNLFNNIKTINYQKNLLIICSNRSIN
jgi:spermidine synthase